MFIIRRYQPGEEKALWYLFFETVTTINSKHYSEEQTDAWAPSEYSTLNWEQRIKGINPFVALLHNRIVGYADVQSNGYIDHFFCSADHQGLGIGKALMKKIHQEALDNSIRQLLAEVSITARPFFEKMGFKVIKQQEVEIRGQVLINYKMEKQL